MQRICSPAAALVGLSLALSVPPSWAQRPPTNDTSDNMGNTAGGTGALTSSTPGNFNTAYGNAALRTNTGNSNTAVGLDSANLPPIESIGAGSDILPFLASGVPADLTRGALRRAWSTDPAIRDFIGLSENSWDFDAQDGAPGFGSLTTDSPR